MFTPVSPKADLRNDLGDMGYIIFGAILFIWELLPTSLLILIFRVPRPPKEMVSSSSGSSNCRPAYLRLLTLLRLTILISKCLFSCFLEL